MARFLAIALVLAASVARAESVTTTVETPPAEAAAPKPAPLPTEPTAADVARAPLPGQESGRTDDIADDDTTARQLGRGALWVPKVLTNALLTPLRGSVWAYDRFSLNERYYRTFFNADRTIGLYPTASIESGFGLSGVVLGARFVDRNLFGGREHLAIEAAAGMNVTFKQLYAVDYRTRHTEIDLGYEVRPRDAFYGIGNADPAVQTRFSQHRGRVRLTGDVRIAGDLHIRPSGSYIERTFGDPASGTPTSAVFDTQNLVGWTDGERAVYGELELRWDGRRAVDRYEPDQTFTTGTLAGVFGGGYHGLPGTQDFGRYGFDLQQFVRLGLGPRVLAARIHGEAVTGGLADVPFIELPALGGPLYLRGYDVDRFRDRIAAFGTLEYSWDLAAMLASNVFVDAGRVWRDYGDMTLAELRVGYGVGLELRNGGGFISELSVASSIDGGMFISLSFNPIYDIDERVRRR